MKRARWSELRKGDLSGPVLAILVTLILLAIGAAIIAYFTLFAGGTTAPIVAVKGQPIAYKTGVNDATVEIVVVNTGNALLNIDGRKTQLTITYPSIGPRALGVNMTVHPGESKTLTFTFPGGWATLKGYPTATGVLKVVDTAGNTVALYEISIRVVTSS